MLQRSCRRYRQGIPLQCFTACISIIANEAAVRRQVRRKCRRCPRQQAQRCRGGGPFHNRFPVRPTPCPRHRRCPCCCPRRHRPCPPTLWRRLGRRRRPCKLTERWWARRSVRRCPYLAMGSVAGDPVNSMRSERPSPSSSLSALLSMSPSVSSHSCDRPGRHRGCRPIYPRLGRPVTRHRCCRLRPKGHWRDSTGCLNLEW